MKFVNFNGQLHDSSAPLVPAGNRGLRYGDGLFETLLYKNGELVLKDLHMARLWKGLTLLQFELPRLFTQGYVLRNIEVLVKKNGHQSARVRLQVLRGDGGVFDTEKMAPQFIIESWDLPAHAGELNSNGLELTIYSDATKTCDSFSGLKHCNYLPYAMAAIYAKKNQCNEAILLNQYSRVCDASTANIFVIKDNVIYTPAADEGCIAGTRREFYLGALPQLGYVMQASSITVQQLSEADELFVSNAIHPLRWVSGLEELRYDHSTCVRIYDALRQTFPGIFC